MTLHPRESKPRRRTGSPDVAEDGERVSIPMAWMDAQQREMASRYPPEPSREQLILDAYTARLDRMQRTADAWKGITVTKSGGPDFQPSTPRKNIQLPTKDRSAQQEQEELQAELEEAREAYFARQQDAWRNP